MQRELSKTPLCVRLFAEDETLLRKVTTERGEGISSFVRRSIRKELASLSYFDEDTKKSLGVHVAPNINAAEVKL